MESLPLSGEQQLAFARVVRVTREVVLGPECPVRERDLVPIARVFAEALRRSGVPCTWARAYIEGGELMAEAFVVTPLGFG